MPELLDIQVFGTVDEGADLDPCSPTSTRPSRRRPRIEVLDRDGFIGSIVDQITLVRDRDLRRSCSCRSSSPSSAIANTLSLSINERTRELGLLRAVGMNRTQLRSAIRWEAVIISVLGTLVGIGLGLLLSWALVTSLDGFGSQRVRRAGRVAGRHRRAGGRCSARWPSILPARRAAKLAILDAIATE